MVWPEEGTGVNMAMLQELSTKSPSPQSLSRVYATGSWDLSASPSLVPGLQRRAGCDGNTN